MKIGRFNIVSKQKALKENKRLSDAACWESSTNNQFDHFIMVKLFREEMRIRKLPKWQFLIIRRDA